MRNTVLEFIVRRPGRMSHSRRHQTLQAAWDACDRANQVEAGHRVYAYHENGQHEAMARPKEQAKIDADLAIAVRGTR